MIPSDMFTRLALDDEPAICIYPPSMADRLHNESRPEIQVALQYHLGGIFRQWPSRN